MYFKFFDIATEIPMINFSFTTSVIDKEQLNKSKIVNIDEIY